VGPEPEDTVFRGMMMGRLLSTGGLARMLPVLLLAAALLVTAGSALHVDGIKILMDVRPGETFLFPMGVGIDPSDPPTDIAIDVMGFGHSADGSYVQVPPAEDTAPTSGRSLITMDSAVISLSPGESRPFNATIRVPADAPSGGRYATIFIHPVVQAGGSGAGITTAVLVPVFLTVQGPGLTEAGSVTGVRLTGDGAEVALENTGNHHYYGAMAEVTVTDGAGNPVANGSSRPSVWAIVPGGTMTLRVPLSPAPPQGSYMVRVTARIGDGGPVLDTESITVTTGGPPVQGTVMVQATRAAGQVPVETTAAGGIPFLPASIPWPGVLLTAAAASVAAILRPRRGRG
jgi:hypothetical protein